MASPRVAYYLIVLFVVLGMRAVVGEVFFFPAAIQSGVYYGFHFRDSVFVVCDEPNGCAVRAYDPGEDNTVDMFPEWFLFAGLSLVRSIAVVVLVNVAVCSGSGFCDGGSVFIFLSFLVLLWVCRRPSLHRYRAVAGPVCRTLRALLCGVPVRAPGLNALCLSLMSVCRLLVLAASWASRQ